jgi:hypothetical protein
MIGRDQRVTIHAELKDGRPALADLDGASPTGGMVTSASRPGRELLPGDVIRSCGTWCVVTDVRHNGITGVSHAMIADQVGMTSVLLITGAGSAEVRTDARIDPDTLWTLTDTAASSTLTLA